MDLLKSLIFCKYSIQSAVNSIRAIQTTAATRSVETKWRQDRARKLAKWREDSSLHPNGNLKWREDRRLHRNPNAHGPLTDLPDYTFMDGNRPTPLGSNQKKRIIKQRQLTERMVTLIKEVDDAKLSHQRSIEQKQQTKQDIIDNKLKPKGTLLMKKKK